MTDKLRYTWGNSEGTTDRYNKDKVWAGGVGTFLKKVAGEICVQYGGESSDPYLTEYLSSQREGAKLVSEYVKEKYNIELEYWELNKDNGARFRFGFLLTKEDLTALLLSTEF